MTEGTKWTQLRIVTPEELGRFHRSHKVKDTTCQHCGSGSWTLMSDETAPAAGIPSAQDDRAANVRIFAPAIALSCQNCGTLWMINYQLVRKWLDEEPA